MINGALDVRCPRCGGTAVVDVEYADYPEWACPFCGTSNPMPSPNGSAATLLIPWAEDALTLFETKPAGELFPIIDVLVSPQQTEEEHRVIVLDEPAPVEAPEVPEKEKTRRRVPVSIAATVIVLAAMGWGIAVQASRNTGPYRTVDGIATALTNAGVDCTKLEVTATSNPLVREEGTCSIGTEVIRIFTFQDEGRRARYTPSHPAGIAVIGRTWIVEVRYPLTARRVAEVLGGLPTPVRGSL